MKSRSSSRSQRSTLVIALLLLLLLGAGLVGMRWMWGEPESVATAFRLYPSRWMAKGLPHVPGGDVTVKSPNEFEVVAPMSPDEASDWLESAFRDRAWQSQPPAGHDQEFRDRDTEVLITFQQPGDARPDATRIVVTIRPTQSSDDESTPAGFSSTSAILAD
jgi:hypothetical protein